MRYTLSIIIAVFLIGVADAAPPAQKLFYNKPAQNWLEALPMGNGRLGAMVHGGVTQEHIQFNEETLWTGKPRSYARKGASKYLDDIRQLLFNNKQQEAQDLMAKEFMSVPRSLMAYQPFGDLIIDFPGHEDYSNYYRELDIQNAISKVSYRVGAINYTREVFVSHPDQAIVVKITTDMANALEFSLYLESSHFNKSVNTDYDQQRLTVKPDREPQRFTGVSEESVLNGQAGLKIHTDGQITPLYKKIKIAGATSATIYLTAHTNFVSFQDVSGRPKAMINQALKKFANLSYEQVKRDHIADYHSLFNRFQLEFKGDSRSNIPTNQRIYQFWKDPNDPELVSLYVQFGRYLMISSSREGSQPANLQGIWNNQINPPWKSKYTTNINAEMNYWPAEVTNLSECHEPFINLVNECAQTGALTAREHYDCSGWVLHHNTDIWRATAPINLPFIGPWVGGSGWVVHHLWERYLFTQDKTFLREEYPVIKKAAQFYSEFLIPDPVTGWLVSTPSNSPEIGGLVAGPTMDHQIIRSLFKICIKAARVLNTDKEFAATLKVMIPKIAPNRIGKHGQLQEWLTDKDNPEEKHRHVSHLWAVHPGRDINWEETPELMKAARQSLIYRGDGGTGWSLAWKINFWARFGDGNRAYKLIHNLLSPAEEPKKKTGGGSYPNLFDAHPPFQIDGNFGGAAGIVEMLIQSHLNRIDLLPALPDALPTGSISGVCARGGFELSFDWENGDLRRLTVLSKAGKRCDIRYKDKSIAFDTQKGKNYVLNGKLKMINK
ncbi:glycoside hydrolase family 95 protein [Fulvivirgaceae bacterium BMA12]|uniref:Glycoside hydrolase family 95 protein n=1 Tax=Agaribacillus aureus TaxID=3051825 RepID=A0ABT8LJD8_9BACT|nr:glycoside hydrolase family 95 protein [Fulvivirgaceae bacterium BMA12]